MRVVLTVHQNYALVCPKLDHLICILGQDGMFSPLIFQEMFCICNTVKQRVLQLNYSPGKNNLFAYFELSLSNFV